MRIETRFAWIIAFCFCFGVSIAGYTSYRLEARHAHDEVKQKADMLLETALAVRGYTVDEVAPILRAMQGAEFHAAQVPSFAAQDAIRRLTSKFPEYKYRESALNPSNVNDRANEWEVGLLRTFKASPDQKELTGETGSGQDRHFYVARPIRMTSAACLQCHSVPAAAPPAMLAKYGTNNGFGWQMGDVVALQVVEVPTAPAEHKAFNSVLVTVGSLSCVFVLSATVFLMLLRRYVTRPLEALTRVAHASSLDQVNQAQPFQATGGQFSELHAAIVRLKASVDRAIGLFERSSSQTKD
jgi:HAMP domain-containing protein